MNRTVLITTAVALFAGPVGCGDDGETPTRTTAQAPSEPSRVEITVDADGYEPSEVPAEVGKPVTLVFTRTTDRGCGHELAIPSEDIERELPLGQPVAVTITPRETGEIRFTCGMDMYDGKVVVR